MEQVKELLTKQMIISEPLQELYLQEIKKHQKTRIVFYRVLDGGIKIPKREFIIELEGDKVRIQVDGLDFITPKTRTYKLKDLKKFTGLFADDFNIYYY